MTCRRVSSTERATRTATQAGAGRARARPGLPPSPHRAGSWATPSPCSTAGPNAGPPSLALGLVPFGEDLASEVITHHDPHVYLGHVLYFIRAVVRTPGSRRPRRLDGGEHQGDRRRPGRRRWHHARPGTGRSDATTQLVGLDGAMDAIADGAGRRRPGWTPASISHHPPTHLLGKVYCSGRRGPAGRRRSGWRRQSRCATGPGASILRNDTFAVSRAGTTGSWGIGLVCGGGLNCAGVGPDGTTVRFPALAELSGDFAPGGRWLGIRALGLALRATDGRASPRR